MVDYFQSNMSRPLNNMTEAVEKKAKYEALIQDASKAFLADQYHKASALYNDALTVATELKMGKMMMCVLKYMICRCLLESSKLEDLSEAVMVLQTLDKSLKERFPAVYCLLAQAHCKLYRFDQALDAINEGDVLFSKNLLLETFYIPGTHIEIKYNKDDDTWLKVKEECSTWHQPDAICNLAECNNITKPYVTPNRNIFICDPAFNGMVIVNCNNKNRPCTLKFHQYCWKFKKDQMYPVQKVSDKDILGDVCFTPNCMNDNIPCTISSIEIIGQNGEVKAHIKESTSAAWPVHKNLSKGAIKKVKLNTPRKAEHPTTPSKQHPVAPKQETHTKHINRNDGYDEDQILAVKDDMKEVDFSREPRAIAGEKQFLFSLFYDYIEQNLVRVCDVYSKFKEINEDMNLKDLDILTFLLETNKIEILDNKASVEYLPLQTEENMINNEDNHQKHFKIDLTQDMDDLYDDFMNDDDDDFESTEGVSPKRNLNNNTQNYQDSMLNENLHENYKSNCVPNACSTNFNYEAAGGDASTHLKNNADKAAPQFSNFLTDTKTTTSFSNETEKRGTENRKLKEYITQLEIEMKEMMEESSAFRKELKRKDSVIESMRKEQEEYLKKIEVCESLYETITDFQKRYESIREDNLKMKNEIIGLMKDKEELEEKLLNINNPESKRQELIKNFQEEFQILQDCINSDWEKKIEKLEQSLQTEIDNKMSLLNKCLNHQYASNKHLLDGYLDQCAISLEVIGKINNWMEKTLNIRNFVDNSEWLARLNFLQKANAEHQAEYSKLLAELHSDSTEKFKMTDIGIVSPTIPNPPREILSDIVQNALNTFYKNQCQLVQNLMKLTPNPTPMAYQMPSMRVANPPYPQYAPQFTYPSVYSVQPTVPRQQPMSNSLLGNPMFQLPPSNGMPSPIIPQSFLQQQVQRSPLLGKTAVSNLETNVQIKELVTTSDDTQNVSAKSETVAITNNVKDDCKEEVKSEIKDESENTDNHIDNLHDKIAQMRKAFKAIALNVKEKSAADNPSEEKSCQQTDDSSKKNNVKEETPSNSLQVDNIPDDRSDITTITTKETSSKSRKKVGTDELLKLMLKKYPGSLEMDVVEIIWDIRKKHNNSLSGISVSLILKESEEYFLQSQRLHMLRYFSNDGNKSTCSETSSKASGFNQQNVHKETISPASSCNSLSKSDINCTPKKTWNTLPPEEVKWTASGEIECSICMAEVKRNNCYTLSCRHSFHTQCVKQWLKSDRSCPNCRVAVTEDDEFPPLPV